MAKKKKGLGISALLESFNPEIEANPQQAASKLAHTVLELSVDQIEPNPDQPRREFNQEALEDLATSIKSLGLVQPITVRRLNQQKFQIIAGERRWRAAKMAGVDTLPAYVRIVENDQALLEMALVENIRREDLNALEVASSYQRLISECGLTQKELSDRLGRGRTSITNYLRLLKLPPEIQKGLREEKISMGHAKVLAGVDDLALQLALYLEVVEKNLSVRQIEEQLSKSKQKPAAKKKTEPSAALETVRRSLSNFFSAKVDLKLKKNGRGQILINFSDEEELHRILDLLDD